MTSNMAASIESHPGFIEEIDATEMELKDVSEIARLPSFCRRVLLYLACIKVFFIVF